MSSKDFIDNLAEQILEIANSDEEVIAILENILCSIKDLVGDEEWEPSRKDLLQLSKDNLDDENLEPSVEEEELEVLEDNEGFKSFA